MSSVRSLLFVPGNRPERVRKALQAGADAVCIDLEDAVPPGDKAAARHDVPALLASYAEARLGRGGPPSLGLRVNGLVTADGWRDLAGLADMATPPDFLMLPKVASAAEPALVAGVLPGLALWPIVESASGLAEARAIAAAPGVAGLLFGAVDFAAESGCGLGWDALLHARGVLATARASSGVQLLDVPLIDVHDLEGLASSSARSRSLGFTGRACIHPRQVEAVNLAFTPTAAEVDQARRLLAAFELAGGGVALLDGRLIDRPVVLAARRLLAQAGRV